MTEEQKKPKVETQLPIDPVEENKVKIKTLKKEEKGLQEIYKLFQYFLKKDEIFYSTVMKDIKEDQIFDSALKRIKDDISKLENKKEEVAQTQIYIWVEIFAALIFIITFGFTSYNGPLALVVSGIFYYVGRYAIWKKPVVKNPK